LRADLAVDGDLIAKCNDITSSVAFNSTHQVSNISFNWFGHDVIKDLWEQPPAKSAGTHDGLDDRFDKLYECIFTLTPGLADGAEHTVTVIAEDQAGETGESVPDQVWFDPAVSVDVFTSDGGPVSFADGWPGQTVYSTNTLKIHNGSDGGVDLFAWIAGSDLESSTSPSKCPDSNVLESDNIEYRCKIGTIFNNQWTELQNPNDKLACKIAGCQGATPLLANQPYLSIIGADHTAECWFRLTYPVPCVGTFDTGTVYIYVRAI